MATKIDNVIPKPNMVPQYKHRLFLNAFSSAIVMNVVLEMIMDQDQGSQPLFVSSFSDAIIRTQAAYLQTESLLSLRMTN